MPTPSPRPSVSPLGAGWEMNPQVSPENGWEMNPDHEADSAAAALPEGPGMLGTLRDLFGFLSNFYVQPKTFVGAAKGAGSTALGLGQLARRGARAGLDKFGPEGASHAFGLDTNAGTQNVASDLGLDPEGIPEKLGFGAEQLAEFLGPAAAKTPKLIAAGGKLGMLANMGVEGANSGLVGAAQGSDPRIAAALGAAGPPLGGLAKIASPRVAAWLQGLAETGYGKAIGATTKEFKDLAADIVPELLKRRITAMTRPALVAKAEGNVAAAGKVLNSELGKVPVGTKLDTGSIAQEIADMRDAYMIKGGPSATHQRFAPNSTAENSIKHINELEDAVYYADPSFENMRDLRMQLDDQVTAGEHTFNRTVDETGRLGITRKVANTVRRELGREAPNVAAANKEFSLWKDLETLVLEPAAVEGKGGFGQYAARSVGRTAAVAAGGAAQGVPGMWAGNLVFDHVRDLVQSTGWRTVSAVNKARLADLIRTQNPEKVMSFVTKLAASLSPAETIKRQQAKRATTAPPY